MPPMEHWIYLNVALASAAGAMDDDEPSESGAAECVRVMLSAKELGELSRKAAAAERTSCPVKCRYEWLDLEDRQVKGFSEVVWLVERGTVYVRAIGPDRRSYVSDPLPRALLQAAA